MRFMVIVKADKNSEAGVMPSEQLHAGAEAVFASGAKAATADAEAQKAGLFEQIGRLKMELEWLNNKAAVCG